MGAVVTNVVQLIANAECLYGPASSHTSSKHHTPNPPLQGGGVDVRPLAPDLCRGIRKGEEFRDPIPS